MIVEINLKKGESTTKLSLFSPTECTKTGGERTDGVCICPADMMAMFDGVKKETSCESCPTG